MTRRLLKVGGGTSIRWDRICADLKRLQAGNQWIVVHGASAHRNEIADKLGAPIRLVESPSGIVSAYTDEQALDIFLMVYAGLINKRIVARMQSCGINAVGLSGVDGRLWEGKRKPDLLIKENGKTKLLSGNHTGKVEKVNAGLIELLLNEGYVPVLCPPAISYDHEIINVDNDRALAVLARSLGVSEILVLFEAPGLLRDAQDEASLVPYVSGADLNTYDSSVRGQMTKKLLGAREALQAGVQKILWGDGRVEFPVTGLLQGKGTVIAS